MSARDELRDCFLSDSRDRFEAAADKYRSEVLREAAGALDAAADRMDRVLGMRTEAASQQRNDANWLRLRADEIGGGPRG